MALCGLEGVTASGNDTTAKRPLTEVGEDAQEFIYRWRTRAWVKIGKDPDVIFSREEVRSMVAQKVTALRASNVSLGLLTTPLIDDIAPCPGPLPGQSSFNTQPGATSLLRLGAASAHGESPMIDSDISGRIADINWDDWDSIFAPSQYTQGPPSYVAYVNNAQHCHAAKHPNERVLCYCMLLVQPSEAVFS